MLNFDWLLAVPLDWARGFILFMYIVIAVAVFFLNKDYIYQGAPDRKWWRNLKLWAALAVASQVYVYWIFY